MSEPERRQTPTERNHELLKIALERHEPVSGNPSFQVSQEKGPGGMTVFTWDVRVPVCEQYPDAEQAFDAACSFASRFSSKYPPTVANGEPSEKSEQEKTARAAAAIARAKVK